MSIKQLKKTYCFFYSRRPRGYVRVFKKEGTCNFEGVAFNILKSAHHNSMSVVRDVTGVLNGLQRICSSGTGLLKSKLQQLARASLSLDTLCRRCNSQNGGIKIDPNWTLRDIPLETHQSNTTPPRASNTTSTPSTPSRKLHTLSFRRCLNSSARPPSSGAVTDNSRHTVEQSAEPTHNQV